MPIVNCFISPDCKQGTGDLIALWADESNQSSRHMTINMIKTHEQVGNAYKIVANLFLPSLWSATDISSLQTGLCKALSQYFILAVDDIIVITQIIDSGHVVENGQVVQW